VPAADLPSQPPQRWLNDPILYGTLCGLASSLGYTAANICLKAVSHCDPIWVSCVKAVPTVLLVGPWVLARGSKGERIIPPPHVFVAIILAGVFGQLVGNVAFQWSLGIVGLALEVPLTLGAMIVTGPLLGRIVLREPIVPRAALSMLLLIVAVAVLSLGAQSAPVMTHQARVPTHGTLLLAGGIAAACLSGFAYAVLGVVIRYSVREHASLSTTLVTVGLVGIVGLGSLSWVRVGPDEIWATPWQDLEMMLLAGVCNAAAFLTLSKTLQLVPIVYVNALNASQAAMAFLAGALLFWEPITVPMIAGLLLTVVGLVLMRGGRQPD
jgi:drug/metabolite transporter, DME family